MQPRRTRDKIATNMASGKTISQLGKHYRVMTNLLIVCCLIVFTNSSHVLSAHSDGEHHRCSHVPLQSDQARHIWLYDANFSTVNSPDDERLLVATQEDDKESERSLSAGLDSRATAKLKRHIETTRPIKDQSIKPSHNERDTSRGAESGPAKSHESGLEMSGSIEATLLNLLKTLERPILPTLSNVPKKQPTISGNDLVPMQIQVHYDASVSLLEKVKYDLITGIVMPNVVKFFQEALSIKRKYTIDKFRIARRCPNNTIYYATDVIGHSRPYCMDRCEDHAVCGEIIVPSEHLSACSYCNRSSRKCLTNYSSEGKGVANTQLLLYVSAKQTLRCKRDQTIAYAAHCAQDTKTDRPVAGHANLCPLSISTDAKDLRALIATVKHELTHVLGFSVSLFAYYRDELGRPLLEREPTPGPIPVDPHTGYAKWSDKVIRKVVRRNWITGDGPMDKEVHLMVTPTVVREVRRHFNCSTLEGAELEDQGSDGTSMTHLEKRLFENEAMTGMHTQNSVYSRITLAVLQDTGWYVANFSRAEHLEWGKDLGCDFVTKSCKSWIDERRARQQSIRPFCDRYKSDLLQIACTEDRNSKAVCNMRHYSEPLPAVYRNFDELEGLVKNEQNSLAHYGGSVDLADYCPFIQEFSWQAQNVTTRGSRCDLGLNSVDSEKNPALEHYGPESRCFEHGRRWEQQTCLYRRNWRHFGAGCYKSTCSNYHANIIVANHSYPCYYQDQIVHVEQVVNQWLYNGTIVCPSCEKICPPSQCQNYDKRIIDLILSRAQSGHLDRKANQLDLLKGIFDEAFNSIDNSKADDIIDFKSVPKYLPILKEALQMIDTRGLASHPSLLARLRENTPYIFAYPIPSLHSRRTLVCSSSISLHSTASLIVTLATMISLTNVIMCMSARESFHS